MTLRAIFLALGATLPPCVNADASPPSLDPVVVTATRSAQADVRIPASVHVITAAEIAASGALHLADVLRTAGSLQVTDFYGDGARAQIDARAFGDAANANTLVLVDGRRLNNSDIATPDLNAIALRDIERIEIIEGGAGALYGDQATGAVINVVTRASQARATQIEVFAGSYGAAGSRLSGGVGSGAASGRLSAEYRAGDNYRAHNRAEYRNVLARGGYAWEGGDLFAEAGHVDEDLQTPGTLFASEVEQDRRQSTTSFREDFSNTATTHYRIGGAQALGAGWQLLLEATRRDSDGAFRLGSAAFGPAAEAALQTRSIESLHPRVSARLPARNGDAELTFGADWQRADYRLQSPFGVQSAAQQQSDAYAQLTTPVGSRVDVTVSARSAHVRSTVIDGFTFTVPTTFSDDESAGQLGVSWRAAPGWRAFARADRSYRYPKVDEMTFTEAGFGANEHRLQTQRGETIEAGLDGAGRWLDIVVAVFRLRTRDEIAFDPSAGPFGFGANVNLPATERRGTLLRTRWRALDALTLIAGAQYVDAEITKGSLSGRAVPLAAATLAHGTATIALPAGMSAQVGVQYVGRRTLAGDFDNSLPPLPAHATVHAAASGGRGAWSWTVRVDNLLGREYSEYGAAGFDPGFVEAAAYLPSPGTRIALLARAEL